MSANTEGLLFNNTRILKNGNKFLGVDYRGTASILGSSYKTLKVPIRVYADADHSTVYRQEWTVENLAFPLDQGRNIDLDSMTDNQKNLHLWYTNSGSSSSFTPSDWYNTFHPSFDDNDANSRRAAARSVCVNGKYFYNDCAIEVIDEMIKDSGWRIPLPEHYLQLVNYFEDLSHLKSNVNRPPIYFPDPSDPTIVQYFCPDFHLANVGIAMETVSASNMKYDGVQKFRSTSPRIGLTMAGDPEDSRVVYSPSATSTGYLSNGGFRLIRNPSTTDVYPTGDITARLGSSTIETGFPTRGIVDVCYQSLHDSGTVKCRVTFRADGTDGRVADPTVSPPQMLYSWLNIRQGLNPGDSEGGDPTFSSTPVFYPIRLVRLNNYNL